ncbi:MAG TPA: site-specific integrase [Oculatellaceae cyanobacterium]
MSESQKIANNLTIGESWRLMEQEGTTPNTMDRLARQCVRSILGRGVNSISEPELRTLHAQLYDTWGQNTADHCLRTLRSAIAFGRTYTAKPRISRTPGDIQKQAKYRVRADRKRVLLKVPTVGEVWEEYRTIRNLRWTTEKGYRYHIYAHLADWLNRPIDSFKKQEIIERHQTIGKAHGKCTANTTFRLFRALCNYAMAVCEDDDGDPMLRKNPVTVLREARIWNPESIKTRQLEPSEMKPWFEAVKALPNPTTTDFLTFLLFTGCRKSEATNLKWEDVHLHDAFVLFRRTKNGLEHRLPICRQLVDMLSRRKELYGGRFVFSQATNHYKPYNYLFRTTRTIQEACGITISPHDLRRGYAGFCFWLRLDALLISRLLNHSPFRGGVTGRYISRTLDPFRPEIQRVGDIIEALINGRILDFGCTEDNIKLLPMND